MKATAKLFVIVLTFAALALMAESDALASKHSQVPSKAQDGNYASSSATRISANFNSQKPGPLPKDVAQTDHLRVLPIPKDDAQINHLRLMPIPKDVDHARFSQWAGRIYRTVYWGYLTWPKW